MIKRRPFHHSIYFKSKKRPITSTCAVPLDPQPTSNDHTSLFQSLVHDLLRRGLLSSAQQAIQRFIASSPTVPDAVFAIEFAAASGVDLGLGISCEILRKLVDLGEPLSAHDFYHDHLIARGIEPDSNIVNSMVICLAKLGKLDDAVKLFDRLIGSEDCVLSNAACTVILEGFYEQDKFLEAFDYFVRISDANVKLGMWIYNVLINGLCHQGYVGEAIQVFDIRCKNTGLPPTLQMFKTLFFGLCKKGWLVEAELVFEEMEVQGFFVDKVLYTSLMNAHGKNKKMKMAMRVYFRMLKKGCDPDICTYNTLIHGFLKMGLFDKAWVLWNLMSDLGIQPNEVTYNLMICYYCKQGKLDCATMLLNSMVPCNLAPCVRSYTPIIAALYKQNRCLEVDEMCERMLESGIIPDHVLFFVLMKNEPKGLELQLCLLMLQAIAKNGCGLDHSSLSNFDKINSSAGLEQEIELILREITRIDLNLCNVAGSIYVSALCEGGKTEAALACFKNVASAGCIPLLFTFNSLIKRLFQDGRFEDVKSLFEIMQNEGIVPNLETYLIMVKEYCKQEDLASAFGILDQMKEMGPKPNVAIYACIIACLSKQGRISEAETVFHRMHRDGLDHDEVAYMTMIKAYTRNGRGDKALNLFEKMIENAIQPSSYSYTALLSGLVKRKIRLKNAAHHKIHNKSQELVQKSEPAVPKAELSKKEESATKKLTLPKVDYATELFNVLCMDDSRESDSTNPAHDKDGPVSKVIQYGVSIFYPSTATCKMLAQQQQFTMVTAAGSGNGSNTIRAKSHRSGSDGIHLPARGWGSHGYQVPGMAMPITDPQKYMQALPNQQTVDYPSFKFVIVGDGGTAKMLTGDIPPNQTIYIKNLNEKVKKEGILELDPFELKAQFWLTFRGDFFLRVTASEIKIRISTSFRQGNPSAQETIPPHNILFIQNLPHEATSMMLQVLFQQYPGFREVRMIEAKPGIAFVEFEDDVQSSMAMQALQGFKITPQNPMAITTPRSNQPLF
ncbi:hypothetical protein DKX38_022194 [Salix brachista]|uniref:RRM domain-containing protein n=1 Tax=Salix brachista TaxID=2182728 RepID=A0A5N5K4P7_9ROSI|nr:hypothetical protein DKX38_022194 [Salix brachista]